MASNLPLHAAAGRGDVAEVQRLLKQEADVNLFDEVSIASNQLFDAVPASLVASWLRIIV
jgi:hypothetical protein